MPHIRDLIEMREHGFPICSLSVRGRLPFSKEPIFSTFLKNVDFFLPFFSRESLTYGFSK